MNKLIDELLAYAKLRLRKLEYSFVELNSLIEQIIKNLEFDIEELSIEWRIEPLGTVTADPYLLGIVFTNLLENAIKFSSSKAKPIIEIGRRPYKDGVKFFIKENGVGFNPEDSERLFGVFQRLPNAQDFLH